MSGPREEAWEAEDASEGVDVPGTRSDIGLSSGDRPAEFGPTGAQDRGPAGSRSVASSDTSVETPDDRASGGRRPG